MFSIVIPAFNEENRIRKTLEDLRRAWPDAEVIVVDDGSADHTVEVARERWPEVIVLQNRKNRGKGYSIRRGILEARGDAVCYMDADGAAPPEELGKLLDLLIRYDVAIGSRPIAARDPSRRLAGAVYGSLVRMLTGLNFRDTQCGLKVFTARAAGEIFGRCRVSGFGIDVEALLIARALGFRVAEIPINWREVPGSKVSVCRDSIKMCRDLYIALGTGRGCAFSPEKAPFLR
jgi:glycosyltransferase involved in cell wall biosynthesis